MIVREEKPKPPKVEVVVPKQTSAEFHIEKAIAVKAVKPSTPQPRADSTLSATVQVPKQQAVAAQPAKADVRTTKAIAVQAVKPSTPQPPADSTVSATVQVPKQQAVAAQPTKADVPTEKAIAVKAAKPLTPQPPADLTVSATAQVRKQQPVATQLATADVRAKQTAAAPSTKPQPRKPEAATVVASLPSKQIRQSSTAAVQSVALQGATAFTRLANGFDFPVGKPEAKGYYKARGFRSHGHLGEDWDGVGGGDTDLGDPIYGIGDGVVVFARDCHMGWGNVIIVRHAYREGGTVKNIDSMYGHLQKMLVHRGDVVTRGQQIATMGNAHGLYDAHLHLEIRKNIEIGMSRAAFARDFNNYYDPTQFIVSHRHLQTGGGTYRIAMNTFTHDDHIQWDRLRNYSGHRGGGTGESASALKKALASQDTSAR